jgi:N-methylhydantoinase A
MAGVAPEPTVTDANLVLGRLGADRFLGGEMPPDVEAARRALLDIVARPLGRGLTEAADGILKVVTTKMAHVVRWVTTERGLDAADFALIAYGGAGPLHAASVARELRIGRIVIPAAPGHFSTFGMLISDLRRDFVTTWFTPLADASFGEMEQIFAAMEQRGREAIVRTDLELEEVIVSRAMDMRYIGQEHAVSVDLLLNLFRNADRDGIKRQFDAVYDTRYGHSASAEPAEIVSLRSAVTGRVRKPPVECIEGGGDTPPEHADAGLRPVYFAEAGGFVETPVFRRDALRAGNWVAGPVLVEEYASTTVVPPGDSLTVDKIGNLVITVGRN